MGKFILTTSARSLAAQIASLVNAGGQLRIGLSPHTVLTSPVQYLIELDRDKVVGTIGLQIRRPKVTELKHLCVHPAYRRQGLGRKLLERGVVASKTDFIYGAVRSDNATNIRNNFRAGMHLIGKKRKGEYFILIFARRQHVGVHEGRSKRGMH